jgi:NAD(P)-dependent dehydrogenase (short-subunit alcohol dehydrogenase family)
MSRALGDIDKVYQTIREQKGKLDILFANAGTGEFAPLGQINEEHFDKQFDVNVKGTLFTVQGALPLMSAGSAIVLNASLVSIKGSPAFSVYSATKAAIRSFARNWAVDLKGKGIRVNAVSPGVIPTPGYHTSLGMTEQQLDDYIQSVTPAIPLAEREPRMRLPKRSRSSPPTKAATSPAVNSSSTAVRARSKQRPMMCRLEGKKAIVTDGNHHARVIGTCQPGT